jgi:hypothetical protein
MPSGAAAAIPVRIYPVPDSRGRSLKSNIKEIDMPEANLIAEHMEVVGADGVHVGTVDHLDGNRIKLTRTGSDQRHHYIPTALVRDIRKNTVTLVKAAADAVGSDDE